MILPFGGELDDDENQNHSSRKHSLHRPSDTSQSHSQQHHYRLQRMSAMKRQDSWTGFKDKAFRVASTVVLPRHMRTCSNEVTHTAMRSKAVSISVKSLPQLRRDEDARARRKLFTRSISAQDPHTLGFLAPTPTEEQLSIGYEVPEAKKSSICLEDEPTVAPRHYTSPANMGHMKRVLFVPTTSSIDELEEDEEASPSSTSPPKLSPHLKDNLDEFHREKYARKKRSLSRSKRIELPDDNNVRSFSDASSHYPDPYSSQPFIAQHDFLFAQRAKRPTTLAIGPPPKLLAISPQQSMSKSLVNTPQDTDEQFKKLSFSDKVVNTPVDLEEDYLSEEEEKESLSYEDYYNCFPPPIFMFLISLVECLIFVYHSKKLLNNPNHGHIGKYSPAPLDSSLIYNPTRRFEIWRYLTYAFVHSGYMHLINNIAIQLILGILLEIVHKWWRVLCIYFAGVVAGSLATSITEPFNYLAGASAGVYALIAAHLSTVILNWRHMEHPWIRVLIFVAFLLHDGGTAIYFSYIVGEKTNVGYSAHLGGAVAGLLVGIHVLKNLQWSEWEIILWYTSIVICFFLLAFAVVWNIVRSDLFP